MFLQFWKKSFSLKKSLSEQTVLLVRNKSFELFWVYTNWVFFNELRRDNIKGARKKQKQKQRIMSIVWCIVMYFIHFVNLKFHWLSFKKKCIYCTTTMYRWMKQIIHCIDKHRPIASIGGCSEREKAVGNSPSVTLHADTQSTSLFLFSGYIGVCQKRRLLKRK